MAGLGTTELLAPLDRPQLLAGLPVVRLLCGADVARPVPEMDEILVEVRTIGVNPADWKVRRHGYWLTTPWVPGWDVSGVVVSVPAGENRFAVGDEVFGMPRKIVLTV